MEYAIHSHVCVAHRFYLIELRLHKYVWTHDACTKHENLIVANWNEWVCGDLHSREEMRTNKYKQHAKHIYIEYAKKVNTRTLQCKSIHNCKPCHSSSVHSNEFEYIILLWSNRQQKCRTNCSAYREHGKFKNSHAWTTITQTKCIHDYAMTVYFFSSPFLFFLIFEWQLIGMCVCLQLLTNKQIINQRDK